MESEGLSSSGRQHASEPFVCACLRVTHSELLRAIAGRNLRTLTDLRAHTGAGDGCTACHRRLSCYLDLAQERLS